VWEELAKLFGDRPRYRIAIHEEGHASFDDTLAVAQSRLAECDPSIEFCGIPDEAQYGFVLKGARGGHGNLVLRSRGSWELHWTTSAIHIDEQWPATRLFEGGQAWACAGESVIDPIHPMAYRARDDQRKAARRRR
jgi:hypothetical protein